jgi:hypothetical protein
VTMNKTLSCRIGSETDFSKYYRIISWNVVMPYSP